VRRFISCAFLLGLQVLLNLQVGKEDVVDLFNKTYYRNCLEVKDTYNTINLRPKKYYIKKKINFFGSAYPIQSEDEVKLIIDGLRKKHPWSFLLCLSNRQPTPFLIEP
jgi:hypothetical protein